MDYYCICATFSDLPVPGVTFSETIEDWVRGTLHDQNGGQTMLSISVLNFSASCTEWELEEDFFNELAGHLGVFNS